MYKCLKRSRYDDRDGYSLEAVRRDDIDTIRRWRNAQMDVLRQSVPISPEEQEEYFQKHVWPSFAQPKPELFLFSFFHQGVLIGYGGVTRLDWRPLRGEVSFLTDPMRTGPHYQTDFKHFLQLLLKVAFEDLGLHRLIAETYAFREETIAVLKDVGFREEGVLRQHVFKRGEWTDSIILGLLAHEASFPHTGKPKSALLITSISKKVPLIGAVCSAVLRSEAIGSIHGCDSDPDCIGQHFVDQFWNCPRLDALKIEDVIAYCREHEIACIIPTSDLDLSYYASHAIRLEEEGIGCMVSPPAAVKRCADKLAFSDYVQSNGFPSVPTSSHLDNLDCLAYVVKERTGAGSAGIGLNLSRADAEAHALKLRKPIFQPFVMGDEWSVDLYRSFTGKVKGCVARKRNLVINGESQITTTERNSLLEDLCCRMAGALELKGHAVFQVIEREKDEFFVVECNPRFGGASTASLAAGLDSFFWFLTERSGADLEHFPFVRSDQEIRLVRHPSDRIIAWSLSSI
jgi:RimJ/RimL family protein N-acetyltransferase/predicted ATP-grasp superfamily ATP-dependent carboligase